MNFEIAMLRAAVGFRLTRPGGLIVTGGGVDKYGEDRGLFVQGLNGYEPFKPSSDDKSATNWGEL